MNFSWVSSGIHCQTFLHSYIPKKSVLEKSGQIMSIFSVRRLSQKFLSTTGWNIKMSLFSAFPSDCFSIVM